MTPTAQDDKTMLPPTSIQIYRRRGDYNYCVMRGPLHIGAVVELTENGITFWRLWKERHLYTPDELAVIDDFAANLGTRAAATLGQSLSPTPDRSANKWEK